MNALNEINFEKSLATLMVFELTCPPEHQENIRKTIKIIKTRVPKRKKLVPGPRQAKTAKKYERMIFLLNQEIERVDEINHVRKNENEIAIQKKRKKPHELMSYDRLDIATEKLLDVKVLLEIGAYECADMIMEICQTKILPDIFDKKDVSR